MAAIVSSALSPHPYLHILGGAITPWSNLYFFPFLLLPLQAASTRYDEVSENTLWTELGMSSGIARVIQPSKPLVKGSAEAATGIPIIIVPQNAGLITIFNSKAFFDESHYIPAAEAKLSSKGIKPTCVEINRKLEDGKTVSFLFPPPCNLHQ